MYQVAIKVFKVLCNQNDYFKSCELGEVFWFLLATILVFRDVGMHLKVASDVILNLFLCIDE